MTRKIKHDWRHGQVLRVIMGVALTVPAGTDGRPGADGRRRRGWPPEVAIRRIVSAAWKHVLAAFADKARE